MISKRAAAFGAVIIILVTAFFSSFLTFEVGKYLDIQSGDRFIVKREVYELLKKYELLEQIRQVIERDYIEEIDLDEQLIGAIRGMTDALDDPYTSYFTPEEYKEFITQTQGSYAGIGLWVNVDEEDNRIYVIKAFKDSPADKAGIHQGDKIVKSRIQMWTAVSLRWP